MNSVQPARSEGENHENPVKELIGLVVNTILGEEGMEMTREMVDYGRNLSRQMLNHLSDLEGQPPDMSRFYASFKVG